MQLISGTVKNEKADPRLQLKSDDRITLEGSTKEKKNNLSILLRDLDFGDTGRYTCHVRNPKEKDLQHQATIFLQVVDKRTPRAGRARRGAGTPHSVLVTGTRATCCSEPGLSPGGRTVCGVPSSSLEVTPSVPSLSRGRGGGHC